MFTKEDYEVLRRCRRSGSKKKGEVKNLQKWGDEVYVLSFLLFQSRVLSLKWEKNEKLNPDGYFDQVAVFILTAWLHQIYDCCESCPVSDSIFPDHAETRHHPLALPSRLLHTKKITKQSYWNCTKNFKP